MAQQDKAKWLAVSGSASDENQYIGKLLETESDTVRHLHWTYKQTTVVLGRSQKVTDELTRRASRSQVDVYQRMSGGGAVIASPNLLSVTSVIPSQHPLAKLDLIKCFNFAGSCWQRALCDIGVESTLCQSVNQAAPAQKWICFAGTSHGELLDLSGKKLLGLAQVRKRHGVAIMMGVYLQAIDWPTLFSVYQSKFDHSEIAQIKQLTSSLQENNAKFDTQAITALLSNYHKHFADAYQAY